MLWGSRSKNLRIVVAEADEAAAANSATNLILETKKRARKRPTNLEKGNVDFKTHINLLFGWFGVYMCVFSLNKSRSLHRLYCWVGERRIGRHRRNDR